MAVVFVIRLVYGLVVQRPSLRHSPQEPALHAMHDAVLSQAEPETWKVVIPKVEEAEMDDMWSFVEHTGQQRWLWQAIDHQRGAVVA